MGDNCWGYKGLGNRPTLIPGIRFLKESRNVGQIYSALWTNIICTLNKYNLHFEQIQEWQARQIGYWEPRKSFGTVLKEENDLNCHSSHIFGSNTSQISLKYVSILKSNYQLYKSMRSFFYWGPFSLVFLGDIWYWPAILTMLKLPNLIWFSNSNWVGDPIREWPLLLF